SAWSFSTSKRLWNKAQGCSSAGYLGNAFKKSATSKRLCPRFVTDYRSMRLKNYKDDLLKRLADPKYAAEYLAQVLAEQDNEAFLIALKDVVEATGGMGNLASRVGFKRPSLYR